MACINPQFIEKIKSLDLSNMTTEQRIQALDSVMGSGGKDINLLYEKKLLLKNRARSFDKFIDDISGISAQKKAKIKENIAKRLSERKETINNEELLGIVQETLNKKYSLDIPDEAVEKMFQLRKEIDILKEKATGTVDGSNEKLEWGYKEGEFIDIVDELKNSSSDKFFKTIKKSLLESKEKISAQEGVLGKTGKTIEEIVNSVLSIPSKGIKAAWDASYIFRQGLKVLTASPKIWKQNVGGSLKSWKNVYNKELMDEVYKGFRADIITRDLYQDAIKSKLAIGVIEDFFPTNIAEKIPAIGNLFKASDNSFTMFSQGSRMDLFEKYVKLYEFKKGRIPDADAMKSIANHVNGLTGRGGLGKAEASSGWLNQLFFSARYQVANLKTFTDPLFSKDKFVQRIAAKNLAVHAATIFGVMTTVSAFTDVGFNPKKSTFGKARIPGTKKWVDVTGGLGSYISTIFRMFDGADKQLDYGEDNGWDILTNFFSGKLAPVPGAIRDYFSQRDYSGKKPTALSTLRSLFIPINADNVWKNVDKKEDYMVVALQALFETIGSGVSQPKSKSEGSFKSPLDLLR